MLCALMVASLAASAQNITFRGGVGTTLYDKKYYPDLYGEGISPVFPSFSARIGWQDYSSSPVAKMCHHPEIGINFQVDAMSTFKTAKSPGIGNIYSLHGYFDRAVVVAGPFSLGYTIGFGLGMSFSNLFSSNPANRLLSSPVSGRFSLGITSKVFVSKRFFIGLAASFNHTSNGAIHFPNRGVNAFEFSLLAGMKTRPVETEPEPEDDGFRRKFNFDLIVSGGVISNEAYYHYRMDKDGVWDNMHRSKWTVSASATYQYARMHSSGIGVDMFITPFCNEIAPYDGSGAKYTPVSVGISIVHEARYRNLALMLGLGKYLYDNDGIHNGYSFYQLVNIRYHLPKLWGTFVGVTLKAHKFKAAESLQLCLGKRF